LMNILHGNGGGMLGFLAGLDHSCFGISARGALLACMKLGACTTRSTPGACDGTVVGYAWGLAHSAWNKLMNILHGNGGGMLGFLAGLDHSCFGISAGGALLACMNLGACTTRSTPGACDGTVGGYAWGLAHSAWNKLMHILHGNGGRGVARVTARKRRERRGDSGEGGGTPELLLGLLRQLLQLPGLKDLLPKLLGEVLSDKAVRTAKPKPKRKGTEKERPAPVGGGGAPTQGTQAAPAAAPTISEQNQRPPVVGKGKNKGKGKGTSSAPQGTSQTSRTDTGARTFADVAAAAARQPSEGWTSWRLREEDWDGPIRTIAEFWKAGDLPDAPAAPKMVVVLTTDDDLEELGIHFASLPQESKGNLTAVLPLPTAKTAPPAGAVCRMIPGKLGTKLQPRRCTLHTFGEAPPALKQQKVSVPAPPAAPATFLLRTSMDKRYVPEKLWNGGKQPGPAVRTWLRTYSSAAVDQHICDVFRFSEETTAHRGREHRRVVGLMRVTEQAIAPLLAASGKGGWYVEPLKWEGPAGPRCSVEWIRRDPGEEQVAYATRVAAAAGELGVALGINSLGIRSTQTSPLEPRPEAWRVLGAPREWTAAIITDALVAAGLRDVEQISRLNAGRQSTWIMRGTPPALSNDFIEIEMGGHTLLATISRPRAAKVERTPLTAADRSGATRIMFKREESGAGGPTQPKPAGKEAIPTLKTITSGTLEGGTFAQTQIDATMNDGDDRKRAAETATPQEPAAKKLALTFQGKPPAGTTRHDTARDGNCLFHAFARQMRSRHQSEVSHQQLRARTAVHLKKHEGTYACFWDGKEPSGRDSPLVVEGKQGTWQQYVDRLAQHAAWGSAVEVKALACIHKCPAYVFTGTGPPQVFNAAGVAAPVLLWYEGGHYEDLDGELAQTAVNQARKHDTQNSMRGGGDDDEAEISDAPSGPALTASDTPSARSSVPLALSARTYSSDVPSRLAPRCALPPLTGAASVANLDDLQDFDDTDLDPPAAAPLARVHGARKWGTPEYMQPPRTVRKWQCPLCEYYTPSTKRWNVAKNSHIRRWHPKETAQLALKQRRIPVQALTAQQKLSAAWCCKQCDKGIQQQWNAADNPAALYAKRSHREEDHADMPPRDYWAIDWKTINAPTIAKAHASRRNAEVAKRMVAQAAGVYGAHRLQTVAMPWKLPNGRALYNVICTQCGRSWPKMTQVAYEVARGCDCGTEANKARRTKLQRSLTTQLQKASTDYQPVIQARLQHLGAAAQGPLPATSNVACMTMRKRPAGALTR
jgi:hypothetical protein